jgi:peptidyl-prolyl cis-trans isomerase D
MAMAETMRDRLALGDTFEMQALTPRVESGIRRDSFVDDAPSTLVAEAFKLDRHQAAIAADADRIALVRLTGITPFDPAEPTNAQVMLSLSQRYSADIGTELFDAYVAALQDSVEISINQALLNGVHAQMP